MYTIGCANTLGFNLHEQGRYSDAENICKLAVDGFTRICGRKDQQTVAAMNNYALCLQGRGKNGEAAKIFKEILDMQAVSVDCQTTVMSNLAECLRLDGQLVEAEAMFVHRLGCAHTDTGPRAFKASCFKTTWQYAAETRVRTRLRKGITIWRSRG